MIAFLWLNLSVALSAFLLTAKLSKEYSKADFLIAWFIIFFAQVWIVEFGLGISGQLFLKNLIIVHSFIAVGAILFCRGKINYPKFSETDLSFIFTDKQLVLALSIFSVFFLVKAWVNLINPSFCLDSHQYHLSFPAAWLRSGKLDNPIVIFGSIPTSAELTALTYYPIGAELWFFWLMAPLHNAMLADLGEAPFYFIGIIAIFSILRKFAVKREEALFAAFLWVLIPNIFKQLRTASQNDVMCAVLLLVFLNYLIIFGKKPTFRNAAFLGITAGMLVGTKVLNLYWLFALMPLALYYLRYSGKHSAVIALFILGLAFIFGSYTYIKTFILTGNPFYPVKITFLGQPVFPGFIDKDSFSQLFQTWQAMGFKRLLLNEGLGLQFLTIILPATLVAPLAFPFLRRKGGQRSFELELLFLAPLIMFIFYLYVIKAYWSRYLHAYLSVGLITGIIFLQNFKWKDEYLPPCGTLSLLFSAGALANGAELAVSAWGSIILFVCLWLFRDKLRFKKILVPGILLVIAALAILNYKYDKEEFRRYPLIFKGKESFQRDLGKAWLWLDEHTGRGGRIAYTGHGAFYPLFGFQIKNDVRYVSINKGGSLPHYYPDGLYRREKDFAAWQQNLKRERINWLFIALPFAENNESDDSEQFPVEDQWAAAHPDLFEMVFSNSRVRIYKVIR
ncbi:MAG: hypothetical protein ACOY3D_06135 [Candidatus Omnitrophota bacterium]